MAGGIHAREIEEAGKEVPIRKIELICDEKFILTKETATLKVKRRIEPSNATYTDLAWKVVNDTGIEVNLASLEMNGDEVMVHAKGDGDFQLRCIAMNGGTVASVRSSLPIKVEGFGTSFMNPYEIISSGLCKERPDSLSEGEDHGVRFLGKKETYISYHNLDFGTYGTEEITMEMFKYMEGPVWFQIYMEEEPNQREQNERTLLVEGSFEEVTGWMVFKKQTYHLSQRVCGVKKISIISRDNFQFKSFHFTPIYHGLELIKAVDYDEIFGDSYEVSDEVVTNIGNNATLLYKNMNFGETVVTKLIVCGRSALENNSIHVKVDKKGTSTYELIEFAGSKSYMEREYAIEPLRGEVEIRFVFLPGSKFDFAWFQFR